MNQNKEINNKISSIKKMAADLLASLNFLFKTSTSEIEDLSSIDITTSNFISMCLKTAYSIDSDIKALESSPNTSERLYSVYGKGLDSIDYISGLLIKSDINNIGENLDAAILDCFMSKELLVNFSNLDSLKKNKTLIFALKHSNRAVKNFIPLINNFLLLLEDISDKKDELARFDLSQLKHFNYNSIFIQFNGILTSEILSALEIKAKELDPFAVEKTFRFLDNQFIPSKIGDIRKEDSFFGYIQTREQFSKHFQMFSKGESNLPLLVTSLPGLGKTHMSIAFALSQENVTLILPEPSDLEKNLEPIIRRLASRKNHKFVLFFDDVDTRVLDWYYFRTNVGGSFTLPDNIAIVIASNFDFPANILSRGRGIIFPMFDEIYCQGMVQDFLHSLGMRKPSSNLISVIAADYVEEFGQKLFEELSPRTLMRYLERYENDSEKRKRTLAMSREEVITTPDAQLFFDVNIKLLKALYGEEAIEKLREEKLSAII